MVMLGVGTWPTILGAQGTNSELVLRTAAEVRRLTADEAEKKLPVSLKGVLTYLDPDRFYRFIQDDTAGIYFHTEGAAELTPLAAGQLVELEGVTGKGEFAPVIQARQVKVLGEGPFPPARQVTFEQISSGQYDSQLVEVQGIVRSVRLSEPGARFELVVSTGGGRLDVLATGLPVRVQEMVDSVVALEGVCVTRFNRQRQLFDTRVLAHGVRIFSMAPADPFAIPAQSISSLLRFTPQGSHGHRVRVAGTVTLCDQETLYLQDGDGGLYVETLEPGKFQAGDRVEVLGFPAPGDYSPMLRDSQVRRMGMGAAPEPQELTVDVVLKGAQDCRLVKLEAVVMDRSRHSAQLFLVLQAGGAIFHAYLPHGLPETQLSAIRNGSVASVTGICRIDPGHDWNPGADWRASSFRLLLRSVADIQVIHPPPFWTLGKLLWATGALGLVVLAAFAWVVVLRRRVVRQTEIIRQKLETEAALKERYVELFENANDVVYTHDLEGKITSINQAGEQLLQHRREQLLGRNLVELIIPTQQAAASTWLRQIAGKQAAATVEWDFVSASGQMIRMEVSTRLITLSGRANEVEGIARDITERKRLESELLEVSNREQRRIGHDLHDGVCQQLVGIAYMAETIGERLQDRSVPEAADLERIRTFLQAAVAQTRGVARGLFPVRLEENGLVSALEEWAVHAGELFQIDCSFSCDRPPAGVESSMALHLYYIVQEAVANAAKHGHATRVAIGLAPRNGGWVLSVRDDGAGFAPNPQRTTGMGLRIMDYRARVIGASLEVHSQVGKGTIVECTFQLPVTNKPSGA